MLRHGLRQRIVQRFLDHERGRDPGVLRRVEPCRRDRHVHGIRDRTLRFRAGRPWLTQHACGDCEREHPAAHGRHCTGSSGNSAAHDILDNLDRQMDIYPVGGFPLIVELSGRPCVVIGGGAVAERKVEGLLDAGAAVTVVSPTVTVALAALARTGRIAHVRRRYRRGDLAASELAFVATGDRDVAAAVAREGRRRGVWVNAADDPAHCDFFLPSVIRRGRLLVAVATAGASPALARAVREDIERRLVPEYATLTDTVAAVRQELRAQGRSPD